MSSGERIGIVYKICPREAWLDAVRAGSYTGSIDDTRDGFIHMSTAAQLAATAVRHFKGAPDLVLVAIDTAKLGDALKWEPSRGGQLFPHLYGPLDVGAAVALRPLHNAADGAPIIPEDIA